MLKEIYDKEQGFNPRNTVKAAAVTAITLIVFLIAAFNVFKVYDNQYVAIRQFGEIVRIVDTSGYKGKWPWQSAETMPKSKQKLGVETAQINTADKKPMLIDSYAVWQITDPKMMIQNMRTKQNAEARMSDNMYSLIRSEFGRMKYDEIIGSGDNQGRSALTEGIVKKVNAYLASAKAGIKVNDIRVKRTDLPKDNEQSVYKRMVSERESTAQQYLSMGDSQKQAIMADTDRQVKEQLAIAGSKAQIIRADGEQNAAAVYSNSYAKDPQFYNLYRTLESYKKTINGDTVIMLPADSPYAKILTGK